MTDYLYFDHAAATTPRPEALRRVGDLTCEGNPSSVHTVGRSARAHIDQARIELAQACLVTPEEVIFTSGATEALHLGIIGAYLALDPKKLERDGGVIYTSPLVHHCVWAALEFLQKQYRVEVKYLPVMKTGIIDLEAVGERVFAEADFIVIEHLNSETGVLQPAAKLGKKMIKWSEETARPKPVFVVDAAASVVTERVGLDFQKCDLLALSGEKFGGLSGSGVLLKTKNLSLVPLFGGSQEWGWRGGTENVVGIAAMNAAYQAHVLELEALKTKLDEYWQQLHGFFQTNYPDILVITPIEERGSHVFHFLLPQGEAALFVAQADLAGLAISAGSACSSGSVEGSRVLLNLGYDKATTLRGVRVSFGWNTTEKDLKALKTKLKKLL